ncbi:MAG: exodeoxyribonuclease III [Desulfobacteraceae bacterium]|nr:exodeoxyribonuclease III [Desulfobacteraceae bacterium]
MAREFTIATYNVNSIRSRLHIVMPWIEKTRVDVLCLQETKVKDEDFPIEVFKDAGYNVVFKGQKAYNGVAIASRHEIEKTFYGFDDLENSPEDEARLIRCMIQGVVVVNAYVPQGRSIDNPAFQYKLRWCQRIKELFERNYMPQTPLVWCGDLNIAPQPEDVYAPEELEGHVCYNSMVRKAFYDVMGLGFTDLFRRFNPGPGHYTFFDYRVPNGIKRHMGWRIDHVLATEEMAGLATGSYIDMETRLADKPSDHAVLAASFLIV